MKDLPTEQEFKEAMLNQPNIEPSVTFNKIHAKRSEFIGKHKRYPTLVLMHPKDADLFVELLTNTYKVKFMPDSMAFQDMKIKISFDVEVGKWELY